MFKNLWRGREINSSSSKWGPVASCGNKSSSYIKSGEFIEQLRDYKVFKLDPFLGIN
jgi:hypothetical protein